MELLPFCKALGDASRLKLLSLLSTRTYCVMALARKTGLSAPAVSQHMKVLREAGLVTRRKFGYHVHYSLNRDAAETNLSMLAALLRQQPAPCTRADGGCDQAEALRCRLQSKPKKRER
ncbi:MAG: ArsR/SmtB family transcription factor [Christensenellales bacterium]|jgi:ArsR family transcriptional regulator